MSSKFFLPHCVKPVYLQKEEKDAKSCGFVTGLIYSFFITLILVAAGTRFYLKFEDETLKKKILYGLGFTLVLIWIIVPLIYRHSYKSMWNGYTDILADLLNQGFTRPQAYSFIQNVSLEQAPQLGFVQGISTTVFTKGDKINEKK